MKKIILTLALLPLLLMLPGCSSDKAKPVAQQAVDALINNDLATFYSLLTEEDKAVMSETNFVREYHLPNNLVDILDLFPEAKKVFAAKDFKETTNGDQSVVTYSMTVPDLDQLGSGALSLADILIYAESGAGKRPADMPEELRQKLIDYVSKNGVPTKTTPRTIELKKEDNQWRVYLNLRKHAVNKTRPEALDLM